MIEIRGDLRSEKLINKFNALAIPTNGVVKGNGCAVMGAGSALILSGMFAGISRILGSKLKGPKGNKVHYLITTENNVMVFSFPTKEHYRELSSEELIKRSAIQLKEKVDLSGAKKVLVPWPGCGKGGLSKSDIRELLAPIFDDRFYLIDKPRKFLAEGEYYVVEVGGF